MVPKSGSANYIYQYRLLPLREVGAMILHPPLSSLGLLVPIYFWNICTQVQLKAVIGFQKSCFFFQLEMFCHFVSNMFSCCLHYFTKRSYSASNIAIQAKMMLYEPKFLLFCQKWLRAQTLMKTKTTTFDAGQK